VVEVIYIDKPGFYVERAGQRVLARSMRMRYYPRHEIAVLLEPLWCVDQRGAEHMAPEGLAFDGVTRTRALWSLGGQPWDEHAMAAAIHDTFCYEAEAMPAGPARNEMRLRGDQLWREMVGMIGDPVWRRAGLYAGVRAGSLAARWSSPIPHYMREREAFLSWQGWFDILDEERFCELVGAGSLALADAPGSGT
jgi:hypothetical protein